jgi:hypothetical protein
MRSGHAWPVTMGRITRGPPCWTRSQDETTSSQVFVRWRMGRRVSLPVVLSPLVQRGRRRLRAKGGVFAFAPTLSFLTLRAMPKVENMGKVSSCTYQDGAVEVMLQQCVNLCGLQLVWTMWKLMWNRVELCVNCCNCVILWRARSMYDDYALYFFCEMSSFYENYVFVV